MKNILKNFKEKNNYGKLCTQVGGTLLSKIKLFLLPWFFSIKYLSRFLKIMNNGKGMSIILKKFGNKAKCYIYDFSDYCAFKEIKVQSYNFRTLMKIINVPNIDILKLNIEGAEYEVLKSITFSDLDKVGFIMGQIHEDLSGRSIEEFMKLLNKYDNVDVKKEYEFRYSFRVYSDTVMG